MTAVRYVGILAFPGKKQTFGNASRLAFFFSCKDTNGNSKSASLRVYSMGWDENGMGGFVSASSWGREKTTCP